MVWSACQENFKIKKTKQTENLNSIEVRVGRLLLKRPDGNYFRLCSLYGLYSCPVNAATDETYRTTHVFQQHFIYAYWNVRFKNFHLSQNSLLLLQLFKNEKHNSWLAGHTKKKIGGRLDLACGP